MVIVKVVYMNGKETEYDVEYPKAYIAKIIERENDLMLDQKSVKEIYRKDKLIAKFNNGYLNALVLEKSKPKISAGCDVGQYAIDDAIAAPYSDTEDYLNEVSNVEWVTNHTGGNIEITYS